MTDLKLLTREELTTTLGIGASEVAAVTHLSPWVSAFDLWQVKTGRKPKGEPSKAMQFGIEMEPVAFEEYLRVSGLKEMKPQVAAVHPEMDFLRAIADGWNGERGVEIKVPSGDSLLESMKRGVVPDHYLTQCAACMSVFDISNWDFFVYDAESKSGELVTVTRDTEMQNGLSLYSFWMQIATPFLNEFWRRMCADKWENSDWPEPDSERWRRALARRDEAEELEVHAKELKDSANAELKQMMGFNDKLVFGGIKAEWTKRKASPTISVVCENSEKLVGILTKLQALKEVDGVKEVKDSTRAESRSFTIKPEKA